jgi:hypothetical protein
MVRSCKRQLAVLTILIASGLALATALFLPLLHLWRGASVEPGVGPKAVCLGNIRLLGLALLMYSHDWSGHLPPASREKAQNWWVDAIRPYVGANWGEVLFCPLDTNRTGRTSYMIPPSASGADLRHVPNPAQFAILTEKHAFHEGRRWAYFADGSWRLLPSKD